ncbi:tRNA (adenosine(37)-N6)-dimethylallyltransferase MiaA [Mucilaginibacter polytrichastri]|uniref:tRNA dimethylallyltransferase n=1 Tax=Mucilaginibacter polytrichastri TaxID=1302689 RepID=A0A1Q5ZTS1_9SPHI|nr:tRNA (adenosine(37)-N6)-dimethylallyltransferase MiaA [Mucilaginibacter polytrichastri]OKS85164.1 tRNA dimethylallyltransferase [Mucilaginibacter polytrichastri]SFS43440.1 tRNA dimethylallyltransferase [Mucilaginibacter polytrichastri]
MDSNKTLIVVAGPTAVGKTAAAINLAQHYNTAILSADSRQFFREMSIGTAKPSPTELAAAPHYFINSHSITDSFNVGDFETEGLKLLDELFKTHDTVILAGGSGLYIKAICEGFDNLPTVPPEIRVRLNDELIEKGLAFLQKKLANADPVYYAEVDIHNPQRLIRALEVFESTGNPFSSYRTANTRQRPFNIVKIGLSMPREQLYNRINERVDIMIAEGMVKEAERLTPYREANALKTVGYNELFDYFDGRTDLKTAIELIKQHTRQFAKRQLTWFNKDKTIVWANPITDDIVELADRLLNK